MAAQKNVETHLEVARNYFFVSQYSVYTNV